MSVIALSTLHVFEGGSPKHTFAMSLVTSRLGPVRARCSLALEAPSAWLPRTLPAVTSCRNYATNNTSLGTAPTSPTRPHRKVTAFNDDGRVKWGDLSPMEKVARTTQQSFNFGIVIGGALLTVGVGAVLWFDVFSTDSAVTQFNHAVDRLKEDETAIALLGPANNIRAYGEASWSRWRRNRPIASRTETDKLGTERLHMHFYVSGEKNEGVVQVMMLRRQGEPHFHYGHLALDVKGEKRHYVENSQAGAGKKTPGTFLGVRWS